MRMPLSDAMKVPKQSSLPVVMLLSLHAYSLLPKSLIASIAKMTNRAKAAHQRNLLNKLSKGKENKQLKSGGQDLFWHKSQMHF